jgi:hypothetical protein
VRSIRAQLTAWYTVALVATVLAFGIAAALVDRRAKYAELDRRLTTEADRAATLMAQAQSGGGPTLDEVTRSLAQLRFELSAPLEVVADYLVVVDSAARIVYGSAETRRFSPAASDTLRLRLYAVQPETPQVEFDLVLDTLPLRFVARAVPRPVARRPVIVSVAVSCAPTLSVTRTFASNTPGEVYVCVVEEALP